MNHPSGIQEFYVYTINTLKQFKSLIEIFKAYLFHVF